MIRIINLNHIQLCIPIGKESEARKFYCEILGLKEIPKPEILIPNGGFWLQAGDIQLHIGVEDETSNSKRHPAFEVANIDEAKKQLEKFNIPIKEEKPIPGQRRFSFKDPFGNRIEFLEKEKS
jgi:catechol 2,3-dioxygenase-like lactoylglutathione lyase family enzyme